MKNGYRLKNMATTTYSTIGTVNQIIVEGPRALYGFLHYEKDGVLHQIRGFGFSAIERSEASEIARKEVSK
jgi:hypothetical protein